MRYIYINIYIQYGMKDDKVFVLTGFVYRWLHWPHVTVMKNYANTVRNIFLSQSALMFCRTPFVSYSFVAKENYHPCPRSRQHTPPASLRSRGRPEYTPHSIRKYHCKIWNSLMRNRLRLFQKKSTNLMTLPHRIIQL